MATWERRWGGLPPKPFAAKNAVSRRNTKSSIDVWISNICATVYFFLLFYSSFSFLYTFFSFLILTITAWIQILSG